ncbi:zinc transporter ZIP5-like [Ylistrum balloti]|uniref:zinc transporter ZIP5-like n=1 Tax=Ylistrum balloti TaxID=509963 RepID=UPI0029059FD1|nr:zinc transporter ZIP5-like [Ylistrum balloti]
MNENQPGGTGRIHTKQFYTTSSLRPSFIRLAGDKGMTKMAHLSIFIITLLIISQSIHSSPAQVPTPEVSKVPTPEVSKTPTSEVSDVSTQEVSTLESVSKLTADAIVDYIFDKYSSDNLLTFEAYEHLLESLSLGVIYIGHSLETHTNNPTAKFMEFHQDHNHPLKPKVNDHKGSHHNHVHHITNDHDHSIVHTDDDHDHKDKHSDDHDHIIDHTDYNNHKDKHSDDHDHTIDHTDYNNHKDKHNDDHDHTIDHTDDNDEKDKHSDDHDHTIDHTDDNDEKDKHSDDHDHTIDHTDDNDEKDKHRDDHDHTIDHTDYNNHNDKHTDNHDHDHADKHGHQVQDNMRDENSSSEDDHALNNRKKRRMGEKNVRTIPQEVFSQCLKPKDILQLFSFNDRGLTKAQFRELCPLLILQIDGHHCDNFTHDDVANEHIDEQEHKSSSDTEITVETWLYACGAIVVISLSGIICVGLLSVFHHLFVVNFLHFLVAMAVGALTGDAMLHLLPHALSSTNGHTHDASEAHDMEGVHKGLAGLAVFYFFFLFGRIQIIASSKKSKKTQKELDDVDSVSMTMVIKSPDDDGNIILEKVAGAKSNELGNWKGKYSHAHGHSHSHDMEGLSSSTGAMVWRVIVGDGIHNLSDGLAIGVAFAVSVTSGLSTSIAVLCHELPHEIGDFAVLLKKGMSVKQALGFNFLSSVLSLIGAVAGVAMGNFTGIKVYILVCVAAMFIYISLVDMLPEISSSPTKNPVRHLVFTMLGMGVGSGIMLIIALKEDELMQLTT